MWIMILSLMGTPEISMDQMELHRDTQITMYRTTKGYLLNSRKEHKAVLISHDGQIIGRYDRKGRGPNEFHNQYVLKVDATGIHFCSNGRFILSFDENLKPIGKRLPDLPRQALLNADFGLQWGKDTILLSLAGRSHLFAELGQTEKGWQEIKRHISTDTGTTYDGQLYLALGKRPILHHRTLFASRVSLTAEESTYEVEVRQNFGADNPNAEVTHILSADVQSFPAFVNLRVLIYGAAKTPDGFVVELFSHLKRGGTHKRWHDYYNEQGQFLKRVAADGKRLIPVVNTDEVFLLEDDKDWLLKRIH